MNTLAVLLAAMVIAGEPKHPTAAHSDAKAIQHAQEQERKMYEQAMHREMEAEKRMAQAQERTIHDQMKAQIEAHQQPLGTQIVRPHGSGYAGRPYSSYHGSYSHSYHHRSSRYHHYRTWPTAQDPELAALHALKHSLDQVHHSSGSTATSISAATGTHQQAIEHALMRVVEVSRPPSVASVNRLAGHLATALAQREAREIDTTSIALALRGGVNAPYLINAERAEVMIELEKAMKQGKVPSHEITSGGDALKNVEHQEIARRYALG